MPPPPRGYEKFYSFHNEAFQGEQGGSQADSKRVLRARGRRVGVFMRVSGGPGVRGPLQMTRALL